MKRVLAFCATVGMLMVGLVGSAGAASNNERLTFITVNAGPGRVVAHGPVNAVGTVHDNVILPAG